MKATPGLSSEKPGIHHLSEERATAKFGIVVGAVEHVERVHHRIEPDEVGGLERSHLVAKTLLEYCVDLHRGRETILKYEDRKSTRLNSSHTVISYAVFC